MLGGRFHGNVATDVDNGALAWYHQGERGYTLITALAANERLEPYFDAMWECVAEALEKCRPLLAIHPFDKTTMANAMHNVLVAGLYSRLPDLQGMEHFKINARHVFTVGDDVALCWKKLDHRYHSRSIPTQQARGFVEQLPFDIPGLEGARTNLIMGYRYGDETRLSADLFVTCLLTRRHNLWVLPVRPAHGIGESGIPVIQPVRPKDGENGRVVLPTLRDVEAVRRANRDD